MRFDHPDRIETDDLERILDLWVAAWAEAMPDIDFAARRSWLAARQAEHLRDGGQLILCRAEAGARPLGFALLNPSTRYLDQLAVDPAHQGRGLARALIEEAKRLCPLGLGLHVNTDNARATRLYEACGFTVTGEGINPRSGLPTLTMAWAP